MSSSSGAAASSEDELRFQSELEFVQCLCNPAYLQCKCKRRQRPSLTVRRPQSRPIFRRACVCQLFGLFAILETARIRAVHRLSDVFAFLGFVGNSAPLLWWRPFVPSQRDNTHSKPNRSGKSSATRSSLTPCSTNSSSITGAFTSLIACKRPCCSSKKQPM
jgi:hypothetical protein